jgi:hypothetical protein
MTFGCPISSRASPVRPAAREVRMGYDEGHGERPATKIGYDLHKRSTL